MIASFVGLMSLNRHGSIVETQLAASHLAAETRQAGPLQSESEIISDADVAGERWLGNRGPRTTRTQTGIRSALPPMVRPRFPWLFPDFY
jgi:hypothetical protein